MSSATFRRLKRRPSIVNRKFILLFLFLLPLIACGRYKAREELPKTQFFAEILKREDQGRIGRDGFFENNLLSKRFPEGSRWCAIALGRIASPQSLPLLYSALHSGDAAVRAAAAFAIGEIEDRDLLEDRCLPLDPRATAELSMLLDDPSISVSMRAIEALGKIGSSAEAAGVVRTLARFSDKGSPYERALMGISLNALARLKDPASVPILERLADSNDSEIRWRALDALKRLQSKTSGPLFEKNLQNPDPEVRSYAACGMGVVENAGRANLLLPLLFPRQGKSGDVIPLSVRICALQSLGLMKNPTTASSIGAAISAEPFDNTHPDQQSFVVQAAVALGNIGASEGEAALVPLLKFAGPIADESVIALAKILRGNPERFFQILEGNHFDGRTTGSAWTHAMTELGGPDAVEELSQMLQRAVENTTAPEPQTIPDILSALAKIDTPGSQEILGRLLYSRDCTILRAAIEAYRPRPGTRVPWAPVVEAFTACNTSRDIEERIEILSRLKPWIKEKDVQRLLWTSSKDKERNVRVASIALLRRAGVADIPEDPDAGTGTITNPFSQALAASRKNSTIAQLETTRGAMEIELFREDAPVTAEHFILMANRGLYDGMEIARVLPFQIEGMIPQTRTVLGRTIHSEINMRPFKRGSVGMALAGKDSDAGGFFIALAPQPQFDGVRTCFGRVISGMPVADKIGPGDRILRIRIKETITYQDYQRY